MSSINLPVLVFQTSVRSKPYIQARRLATAGSRRLHINSGSPVFTSSIFLRRPVVPVRGGAPTCFKSGCVVGRRTIFIQTENTPNADVRAIHRSIHLHLADIALKALKFKPNHPILPPGLPSAFLEYLSPRSTLAAPHPSPLAAQLLNVDGITSVFYGSDFITVTKAADANWAHIKPEVFSLITEAVTSGAQIVNTIEKGTEHNGQDGGEEDTLGYKEDDSEVVGMIKELLETRIRPAIQEDGGDIEFRGFEGGNVLLKLRGACRTCDSSTVTLKNGIESMLMHYVSWDSVLRRRCKVS